MEQVSVSPNAALIEKTKRRELAAAKRKRLKAIVFGLTGVAGFLLLWYAVVWFEWIDSRLIVYPHEVFQTLASKFYDKSFDGSLLPVHIASSLIVAVCGFLMAVCVGVPLGLLMGWYQPFDRFVRPVFEVIRPIPPISWIPIMIIFLGIGLQAKTVIIFFAAFIPSLINSYTGIKLTNPVFINVAKTCGASKWRTFLRVGVPSALPMAFAGMRISLGNAWGTLVAAEMLAANKGLGFMILMGRTYLRVDVIIGGMLVIGLIGVLFAVGFDWVEHKVIKWGKKQ